MNMHMHEMYAQPVSLHIYDVLSDSSKNLSCYKFFYQKPCSRYFLWFCLSCELLVIDNYHS
jgi:hypothetical protein